MSAQTLTNDRAGAVSVLFAAAALPIVSLAGLSIDFAFVNEAKSELALAADTAAMVATKTASSEFTAHGSTYLQDAKAAGAQWFTAETGNTIGFAAKGTPTASVSVAQNGTSFTSSVAYSGKVQTYFSAIIGLTNVPVGGNATASINLDGYVNISMLLDNSSSMLIGATTADINTLQTATPCSKAGPTSNQPSPYGSSITPDWSGPAPAACTNGQTVVAPCGFACHWSASGPDYYYLARNATTGLPAGSAPPLGSKSVTLRFDLVQSATETVINTMETEELLANQYQIGVFEFNNGFTQVYPASGEASPDLSDGEAAVTNITTPVVSNDGDTDFPDAITQLTQRLTNGGDGSSTTSPRKNLFIVTDGMQDYTPTGGGRSLAPFNTSAAIAACNKIKAMNIAVYVLYTPYTALPYNPFYMSNINAYNTADSTGYTPIEEALQQCASSTSYFYEASNAVQIKTAMTKMLQSALKAPARINS